MAIQGDIRRGLNKVAQISKEAILNKGATFNKGATINKGAIINKGATINITTRTITININPPQKRTVNKHHLGGWRGGGSGVNLPEISVISSRASQVILAWLCSILDPVFVIGNWISLMLDVQPSVGQN